MTKSWNLAASSCVGSASLFPLFSCGSLSPWWLSGGMLSLLSVVKGISSGTSGGSTAGPTSFLGSYFRRCL